MYPVDSDRFGLRGRPDNTWAGAMVFSPGESFFLFCLLLAKDKLFFRRGTLSLYDSLLTKRFLSPLCAEQFLYKKKSSPPRARRPTVIWSAPNGIDSN